MAFCLDCHLRGLELTIPEEIAEITIEVLFFGSKRKPAIFFNGKGFSQAQIQFIQSSLSVAFTRD